MTGQTPSQISEPPELLPLSLLNDYLYCPRRAALKLVEGWREANVHTVRGDIVHDHADLPGYEVVEGVRLLRALPVWSERLGLNGKCDIVEVRAQRIERPTPKRDRIAELGTGDELKPVEFKVGKRRRWENDDVQLCAQGLCLEEMFGGTVARGAVFHAESKRRREVEFTADLRKTTEEAAAALHHLFRGELEKREPRLPAAVFKPACEECSLYEVCLPQVTSEPGRVAKAAEALYET